MRVVLDTNVFVSSFLGKGPPRQLINLWKQGLLQWCLSREIIEEYSQVFARLGLANTAEFKEIIQLFAKGYHSLYTARTPRLSIVKKDPADDRFLECAVALEARFIISGDKHLLELKSYMETPILSPKNFLDAFKEGL